MRAEANLEPHFLHTKLRCTQHQSRLKPWHKLLVDCSVDFTVSFAYFVLAKHCSEKCPAFALPIDCLIRITRKKQCWKYRMPTTWTALERALNISEQGKGSCHISIYGAILWRTWIKDNKTSKKTHSSQSGGRKLWRSNRLSDFAHPRASRSSSQLDAHFLCYFSGLPNPYPRVAAAPVLMRRRRPCRLNGCPVWNLEVQFAACIHVYVVHVKIMDSKVHIISCLYSSSVKVTPHRTALTKSFSLWRIGLGSLTPMLQPHLTWVNALDSSLWTWMNPYGTCAFNFTVG